MDNFDWQLTNFTVVFQSGLKKVKVPDIDCDVILQFPSGKEIVIQSRPSTVVHNYNGSLDIILPYNMNVVCWEGDEMTPSKASHPDLPEERFAKQLVTEIP